MVGARTNSMARDGSILALVLAGGRGERLKVLTDTQAKPGLPFGACYRLIDFPLSNCINSGLRRIGVITQYRAHTLIHHVQRAWAGLNHSLGEFVELWPAQQQTDKVAWYAGTADAVYQNIALIRQHRPRHVLILAGDHVYKQDYGVLIDEHLSCNADVTVASIEVPRAGAGRFGILDVDADDRVVGFVEKPASPPGLPGDPTRALASMGVYVFRADVLLDALTADSESVQSRHDFGRDIIPKLVGRTAMFAHRFTKSCVGQPADPYWRDVGTIDSYWEANIDLVRPEPGLDLYDRAWPIWTMQEPRSAARITRGEGHRSGIAVDSIVAAGCVVSGGTVRRSILCTDAHVAADSLVEDSVLLPRCHVGADAVLKRCILAEGCEVPAGMIIGEHAVQDAERFLVSAGGVTVVTPEMLSRLRAPVVPFVRSERRLPAPTHAPGPLHAVQGGARSSAGGPRQHHTAD